MSKEIKTVHATDVATYILEKLGTLTSMKLQKLCYYSQAWSLVWDESYLFQEPIEAWINGPVIPDLWNCHSGMYQVTSLTFPGNSSNLSKVQKETIDNVINFYSKFNSQQLSDITHQESPWILARVHVPDNERSNEVISHASMSEYYSGL